jgi:hypothetical protein
VNLRMSSQIEILIKYVPPQYLAGLKTIVLTNREGLARDQRKAKGVESKSEGTANRQKPLGRTMQHRTSSQAAVWLYVDNLRVPKVSLASSS